MFEIKSDLEITNPFKKVEIRDQFGFNCLRKYNWFVKTSFTKLDELYVSLSDGKNVSEVLNKLKNLQVIFCLTKWKHKN